MSLADKFRNLGEWLSRDASSEEIKIFEYKSIKVFGSEKEVSEGQLPDVMIRQLAEQMGVSETEVRRFLGSDQSAEGIAEALHRATTSARESVVTGPVVRVECPDCHRTVVNRKGYCMYCGAVLPEVAVEEEKQHTHESRSTADEVDEKYLKTEIDTRSQDEDDTDSFMQRLRRM